MKKNDNMLNHMQRVEYLMAKYLLVDEDALCIVDVYEHGIKGSNYKPHCKVNQLVLVSDFDKWVNSVSFDEIYNLYF